MEGSSKPAINGRETKVYRCAESQAAMNAVMTHRTRLKIGGHCYRVPKTAKKKTEVLTFLIGNKCWYFITILNNALGPAYQKITYHNTKKLPKICLIQL